MTNTEKCVIDNWSLEHAGLLLDINSDIMAQKAPSFDKNLGGLSNFIISYLLYGDRYFIINGFEKDWTKFSWFKAKINSEIRGITLDELGIDWHSSDSYSDLGIRNYLLTCKYFDADLIVAPERSDPILSLDASNGMIGKSFLELLGAIDNKVIQEKNKVLFTGLKVGLQNNLIVPSLTQYILSEATNREDLLEVILQLKRSKKIENLIRKMGEISTSVKQSGKLQQEMDAIIKREFGKQSGNQWSISLSAMFLSVGRNIDFGFFDRREHIVFLRKLVECRAEGYHLQKNFERIFKKKLVL